MSLINNVPSFTPIFSAIFCTRRNPAAAFIRLLPLHLNFFFANPFSCSSSLSSPSNNSCFTWLKTLSGSGFVYLMTDRWGWKQRPSWYAYLSVISSLGLHNLFIAAWSAWSCLPVRHGAEDLSTYTWLVNTSISLNPLNGLTSSPFMLWARRNSEAPQRQISLYFLKARQKKLWSNAI